jgi:hypothetical protein
VRVWERKRESVWVDGCFCVKVRVRENESLCERVCLFKRDRECFMERERERERERESER